MELNNKGEREKEGIVFTMKLFHHHKEAVVADYNVKLSQLHQRVWQDVLRIPATIDENGWIQFGQTNVGELTIHLREYSPEGMTLTCRIFEDYTDKAPAPEVLMRICNRINMFEDAKLTVHDPYSAVSASIYLILNASRWMPDEGLIKAVIGPAMTRIKAAKDEFVNEIQKLK